VPPVLERYHLFHPFYPSQIERLLVSGLSGVYTGGVYHGSGPTGGLRVHDYARREERMTPPIINIHGERVALGPLRRDLVPLYQRWINDFDIMRTFGVPMPVSLEQAEHWYEEALRDERTYRFTIYERDPLRPIGKAGLYHIDLRNRRAEFGILIGEADAHGKGYGTEVTRLLLDYGFTTLGLHNVFLEVASYNHAGIRAYQNAGFKEIGRRREAYLMEGRWYDKVYMDILSTEFQRPAVR
jgi:RimJ/RimL family protein N-acetyltransferase